MVIASLRLMEKGRGVVSRSGGSLARQKWEWLPKELCQLAVVTLLGSFSYHKKEKEDAPIEGKDS